MSNIPEPHGGQGLINRFVPEVEKREILQSVSEEMVYQISNADLSTFYRIADGGLSPLTGPMTEQEFYSVLENEVIIRDGTKYAWTIPLAFPIAAKETEKYKPGDSVRVINEQGNIIGILDISDIYKLDKKKYNKAVYGTDRTDHPGPRIVNDDPRDYMLGGTIRAFTRYKHPLFEEYMLTPAQSRKIFNEKGWNRIVAFQTRNPLHRAHEYTMVYAMEKLTGEGNFTGVVLNPLMGETKKDDVPASVRMKTYKALIDNRLIGNGDKDEDFWKTKDYEMADQMLLMALDIKMFYAGPKEAVMHAIYRQNFGFTDIIIGRKHADAPFDDGNPVWGDFDAQEIFNNIKGELLIKPVNVGFAAYYEELGRVGLVAKYKDKGYTMISIAGKQLRKKLANAEPIDERVMRKPVSEILSEFYMKKVETEKAGIKSTNIRWHDTLITKRHREESNKHKAAVLWFTGLSGSGKSTVAVEVQSMLFKRKCQVYILDGDNIRHGLNKNLGFSPEDREENIRRIGEVAKLFAYAGFLTLTAFISPYRKGRDAVREILKKDEFIEIFVKTPVSVCEERDPKGLYKKARAGEIPEFTGISAPYEEPLNPELILETDKHSPTESAKQVIKYLEDNGYISKINN